MYDKYVKDIMSLYDSEDNECEEIEKKNLSHEEEDKEFDKIHHKYDELLLDLNTKYNIIFRYDLCDAWDTQISTLVITGDKKDNMWCIYDNEDRKDTLENAYFTVNADFIKHVIEENKDNITSIKEVECPEMLDGVKNNFYFNIDGKHYTIEANNLWTWYEDIPKNVKTLLDVFNEIYESIKPQDNNIDRCMNLGR